MRPKSIPAYCVHKRSGRAYVTLGGQQIPLGIANTAESRAAYQRHLAEWLTRGGHDAPTSSPGTSLSSSPGGPTVAMVLEGFMTHALAYYSRPAVGADGMPKLKADGSPVTEASEEIEHFRQACRAVRTLYGGQEHKAKDFGPLALQAVRESMIRPGEWILSDCRHVPHNAWSRTHTNRQIGRIRHIFRWAASKELVPMSVYQSLLAVDGLRKGKTKAPEPTPVGPIDEARVLAILPYVSKQVAAMIKLQLYAGLRSTEVCIVRPCDVDRSKLPWVYTPAFHKTEHHGISRKIPLGPKARAALEPFLEREAESYCFSPAEAEAERREQARKNRKTKVQPSQVKRAQNAQRRSKQRKRHVRYDRNTYYRAVQYGCELAFHMPKEIKFRREDKPEDRQHKAALRKKWYEQNAWHPHQLRHTAATELRRHGGMEVAQIQLGHTNPKTTEIYAEADVRRTHEVIERVG